MSDKPRLTRAYRIWFIVGGIAFLVSFALIIFFSMSDYGFLWDEALHQVGLVSFINLLVSITVWLCRRVLKKIYAKVLTSIACAVLSMISCYLFFIIMWLSLAIPSGLIIANRHYIHTSPGETNRFVIIFSGMDEEGIYAYPMINCLVYKEVDNGFVWSAHIQPDEYTVSWPSENQAVVEVLRHDDKEITIEGRNLDDKIIVDF